MRSLSDEELASIEASHPEMRSGVCPTCRDATTFTWQGQTRACACREQKRLYTLYARAGIGLKYMRMTWADVTVPTDQLRPVMDYLDKVDAYVNAGMGLFLSGSVGSGKTTVLNLILKDLVRRDYDCYSTTFVGAIDEFAATWRDDADKQRFAARFEYSKVLGLDDVGKEFSNRLSGHTLDRILRSRDQEDRPTIVTTNLTGSQVYSGYGGPVLSLLVGQSIEVPLSGEDFRVQSRKRRVVEIEQGETRPIQ